MSTTAVDKLEFNPFYKSLQNEYRKKYDNAKKSGTLICIPQTGAIHSAIFTPEFVDEHLLTPSPYRKSHYFTTNRKNRKEYEMKENFLFLKKDDKPLRGMQILEEECGYNKDFEQFSILVIESPLCPVKKGIAVQTPMEKFETDLQERAPGPFTYIESMKHLNRLPEHKQVLSILDKEIIQFRENYMIHESFLPDAAGKLKIIASNCLEELQNTHRNAGIETALTNLVESYVMGCVHDKVFPIVCHHFATQDRQFANKLKLLSERHLIADQLGVAEHFCCAQTEAVVELAAIDTLKTCSEKLLCIVNTIDFIMATVERAVRENEAMIRLVNGELPCVTSDELIPLLVIVIVQAKLSHLESNLFYLEHFKLFSSVDNKCSFSLVTFQAAVEYIRNNDFIHLQPCRTQLKKEMSLKELMEVTKQIQKDEQVAKAGNKCATPESTIPSSRPNHAVNRELQKITRMIEASTRELQQIQMQQPGTVQATQHQRTSSLSGFLCGHQESFYNVSFGKQA